MTSIQTNLGELKQQLPHLKEVTDEGWVLSWGDENSPVFEIICPSNTISTLSAVDKRLSEAYEKAKLVLQ